MVINPCCPFIFRNLCPKGRQGKQHNHSEFEQLSRCQILFRNFLMFSRRNPPVFLRLRKAAAFIIRNQHVLIVKSCLLSMDVPEKAPQKLLIIRPHPVSCVKGMGQH